MDIASAIKTPARFAKTILRFYYVQRFKGFDSPTDPHLEAETVEWLQQQLKSTNCYVEFGSGGSTMLAVALGIPTISVESDRFYADTVRRALGGTTSVRIVVPRMGLTYEWGMPVFFKASKGIRYVTAPFGDRRGDFPDLILVDGRYRVACALESARRAHRLGSTARLLVDDYEGRPHYHVMDEYLGAPEPIGRAALFVIGQNPVPEEAIKWHAQDPR
jgi:hypothetical protein